MENKSLLEQFKEECEVVNFKYEYPGHVGHERFGIITKLLERELIEKYQDIVKDFIPYIILDSDYKEVRNEFRRNEKSINGDLQIALTISISRTERWKVTIRS